ncbi:MAG TPA: glycerol-3-phosphate 1-O-acyltransferase PlsY [Pyrinomonadaceae bacterium]|jgi:glycerol-3-phosphate acyltransferase PlsY|nr:glycerol-3-phosphate 1-O-acyltransferase PlsY [Pyrinomonadaceae bacterium]
MFPVSTLLLAYLLGSIPFGYLIVKMSGQGDVRETGSGGTGATNVSRRAGRWAGVVTLVLDALKGTLAVVVARWFLTEDFGVDWYVAGAALAAVLGHIFPVWLGFRGGKGVATGLGVFLSLSPLAVLCAVPVFVAVVWATRYVSLGSMTAAASLPVWVWLLAGRGDVGKESSPLLVAAILGSAIIILMHRANIGRLMRGTESKLK